MYKIIKTPSGDTFILRISDYTFIPLNTENTDYQQFKADVLAGAELQDTDGAPMSQEAATAFIGTLP